MKTRTDAAVAVGDVRHGIGLVAHASAGGGSWFDIDADGRAAGNERIAAGDGLRAGGPS